MTKKIVLLHGWALKVNPLWQQSIKLFKKAGYQVFFPKIPGLTGKKLTKAWDLRDYGRWLANYLQRAKIKNFILVGHSFGGNIALKYVLDQKVLPQALVLIDSSGVRSITISKKIKRMIAKTFKVTFVIYPLCLMRDFGRSLFYRLIRSQDYLQTKGMLTKTLQNILGQDLSQDLSKINLPTLIIWGAKDKDTPLAEGKFIAESVAGSKFILFKHATHGLPFQQPARLVKAIDKFCQHL